MALPMPLARPVTAAVRPFRSNSSKPVLDTAQPFYKLCNRDVKQLRRQHRWVAGVEKMGFAWSTIRLVVKVPEIDTIIHHPDGDDREGEDLRARLQVAGDDPVGRGKRYMRV